MVIWGIIGLLQSLILPGLIALKALKIRTGVLEFLIYLFGLSLTGSYVLVFFLAGLGIYTRTVLLATISLECVALVWLYWNDLRASVEIGLFRIFQTTVDECLPFSDYYWNLRGTNSSMGFLIWVLSGGAAISAIFWGVHILQLKLGTVFSGWDTLFSWNQYALMWSENRVPVIHGMYAQLLPANWSISYVLQGQDALQLFNVLIPPLFFLMIFVMLFDLGFQRREIGFFLAAIAARYMMKKLLGDHIADGYMDVPAACLILLTVYVLLKTADKPQNEQWKGLVLSVVMAAAAVSVKQSGVWMVIFLPYFVYQFLPQIRGQLNRCRIVQLVVLLLLIAVPWYLHCYLQSLMPGTEGEGLMAAGIVKYNLQYEWSHKLFLARQALGKYQVLFVLSLLGLPFIDKRYRLAFFLLSWPQIMVWVLFFSYDVRNAAVSLPFIALSASFALVGVVQYLIGLLRCLSLGRIPMWFLVFVFLLAVLAGAKTYFNDDLLHGLQRSGQRDLFGSQLNKELLYDVIGDEHAGQDILTDYPAYFLDGYKDCCQVADFANAERFRTELEASSIRFLLIRQNPQEISWDTAMVVENCVAEGRCKQQLCSYGYFLPYCLYTVHN